MSIIIDTKANAISRKYWKNNRRFSALCDAVLFHGKGLVDENSVLQWDSEETTVIDNQDLIYQKERRRDLIREIKVFDSSILVGIENQQYKDKSMPLRDMEYTFLNYENQSINSIKAYMPVFMIVLFYGEHLWTRNFALSDIVEVPEELKDVFNDWKPILVDIKKFDYRLIKDKEVRDCFKAIQRIYEWDGNNDIFEGLVLSRETALFVSVVTHCKELEELVEKYQEEEEINMCASFDQVLKRTRGESKIETLIMILRKKLGTISEEIINKMNQANDSQLNELSLEIFDIQNEEDIIHILS